jgi:hypothetical protein
MAARFGNVLYWLGIIVLVLSLVSAGSWIVVTNKNLDDAREAFGTAKLATAAASVAKEIDEAGSNTPSNDVKKMERDAASTLATATTWLETAERRYQEAWWIAAGLAFIGSFVCGIGWMAQYVLRGPR